MSLATVIRLEFAYPGVGVLAGDSLQYLSIATAHGVIMVFFMIMPSIYGAFGNFLLPTQLGVHDVAFPRLNSAAFWFLPGGLIMLCQLICTDRRYQRMNCFNIRELQGILKRRFFTDLINSNDHRDLLNTTMIGLRYKTGALSSIEPDMPLFFNLGTTNTVKTKQAELNPYVNILMSSHAENLNPLALLTSNVSAGYTMFEESLQGTVANYMEVLSGDNARNYGFNLRFNSLSLSSLLEKLQAEILILTNINLNNLLQFFLISNPLNLYDFKNTNNGINVNLVNSSVNTEFSSELSQSIDAITQTTTRATEYTNMFRELRFFNPLVSYDYKSGNYLGI
jgi:hypothetical protein